MVNKIRHPAFISPRAESEMQQSFDWYEDQQIGLGTRFVKQVFSKIRMIETHPEKYSIKHKNYRETGIQAFPFIIIYRINKTNGRVNVVSVFNTSRNPKNKYR